MTLKDIQEKLDLNNKYPGYFTKIIFRVGLLLMVLVFVITFVTNDFTFKSFYVECPKDSPRPCVNPFYFCNADTVITDEPCPVKNPLEVCAKGYCRDQLLFPGNYIGEKPNLMYRLSYSLLMAILAVTFVVNHLWYVWRQKH